MKNKIKILLAWLMAVIVCLSFAACTGPAGRDGADGKDGIDGIDGKNGIDGIDGVDGQNGQDSTITIQDIYNAYLAEYPNTSFADFLKEYFNIEYNDLTGTAVRGIQSAVSIFCLFEKTVKTGVGPNAQTKTEEYSSAGSGVVYRIRGDEVYIITNYHVVYDSDSNGANHIAKEIVLFTYGLEVGGYEITAEFAGGSISKDIAVLKADINDFKGAVRAADLADSYDITLGETVVAVGNPMAHGLAVSSGIVSVESIEISMQALDNANSTVKMRVIRTDAAINKGNSGGGLYNARGQLVGIVNAKIIDTENGVENMGYAIPVNVATGIANAVIDNNSKKCVFEITALPTAFFASYDASQNKVILTEEVTITSVSAGTSAAAAGLKAGDVLVSISINDGEALSLTRYFFLNEFLYTARLGDTIYLQILRGGSEITVEFTPTAADFSPV